MRPSHPAVATLLGSCGCHSAAIHTLSCAFHFVYNLLVFQSQMNTFPSASPETR